MPRSVNYADDARQSNVPDVTVIEGVTLMMQRMELNLTQAIDNVKDKVSLLESRIDNLQSFFTEVERSNSQTLGNALTSAISHLNAVTMAALERNNSSNNDLQVLSQFINLVRQNNSNANMVVPHQQAQLRAYQQMQHANLMQNMMNSQMANLQVSQAAPQPQHLPTVPNVQTVQPNPPFTGSSSTVTSVPQKVIPPTSSVQPSNVVSSPPVPVVTTVAETKTELPKEGFGDTFAKKQGEWDCTGCYVRNAKDATSCSCCGANKDGAAPSAETKAPAFKPQSFSSENKNALFGLAAAKPASPVAGSLFGGVKQGNSAEPKFSAAATEPKFSFASMTSGGSNFLNKSNNATNSPNALFGAQKSASFTAAATVAGDGKHDEEQESPEDYVPDAHYEPVVPLPEIVAVRTGEEDEVPVFDNRGKLYVFNKNEVKERGVGPVKILFNPTTKAYRVVVRRDQVLKICANFRITSGMKITDKAGTKACGTFSCTDFSESGTEGVQSVFIIRFRDEAVYNDFKKAFEEIADGTFKNPNLSSTVQASSASEVPTLPAIDQVEGESGDEYEGEDEEEYEDEVSEAVVYEEAASVVLSNPFKSPLAKATHDESIPQVNVLICTEDDQYFRVALIEDEHDVYPHYLEHEYQFNLKGDSLTYVARSSDGRQRKSVTLKFNNLDSAKAALTTFEKYRDMTPSDNDDD